MTTIAAGSSAAITIADGGKVTVATNGGFWTSSEVPAIGSARSSNHGPDPKRRTFGPYVGGATLTLVNQTVDSLVYIDYEPSAPSITPVVAGTPQTFTVADQGYVAVSTNGGLWQSVVTPAIGNAVTRRHGPAPARIEFGPYPVGANVVITNQTADSLLALVAGASGGGSPAVFTATQLAKASRVYQRDTKTGGGQGLGAGTVPYTVNVTVPGTVYARRRSIDGSNTVLQDWWLVGTVSAGAQTLNVTGVDVPKLSDPDTANVTNDGYFYLDLSGDKAAIQLGTTPITMGHVIAAGTSQSLVYRLFTMLTDATTITATTGYATGAGGTAKGLLTVSPFGRIFVNQGNNGSFDFASPAAMAWQLPFNGTAVAGSTTAAYNSAGVTQLVRLLIKQLQCPIGFIGATCGQTAAAFWTAGNGGATALNAVLAACDNKWSGWYLTGIGHQDSLLATAPATFAASWVSGVSTTQALNTLSGGALQPLVIAFTIPYVTGKYGTSIQTDNAIRQVGLSTAIAQGWKHLTMPDLSLSDGVHPDQKGAVREALHMFRAARPSFVGGAGDHVGPSMTSVTRAGAVGGTMTVNLSMNGATSLALGSGGNLTQFATFRMALAGSGSWNNAGTPTPYLLGQSDLYAVQNPGGLPGTSMTLVDPHPDTPVDVWFGGGFSSTLFDGATSYLYDNRIETDEAAVGIDIGRPLEPNVSAYTAAGTGNVNYNLTPTGTPTYSASSSGFGTALDVAKGTVAFGITPARTLLLRFNAGATLPSALEALGQAGADWFGLNTDGTVRVSVGGTVLNAAGGTAGYGPVTDGAWHELELGIQGGSGVGNSNGQYFLYLDGTRIATAAVGNKSANSGSIYARAINNANVPINGRLIDSLAAYSGVQNNGATKTVLAAPLVGNEANLRALYNFEGNLLDACTN